MTLGITARETRELIVKWQATADLMREAASQDFDRGQHEEAKHALGIADGLGVAIWSLKLLAGEYEGETIHVPRVGSIDG